MAALSASALRNRRNDEAISRHAYVVANTITVYPGALVLLNSSGRITDVPANGLEVAGVVAETDAVTGDSTKTALVEWGAEWQFTTSTITAALLGKNVSMLTDNDITTRTGAAAAAGVTAASVAPIVGSATGLTGSDVWVAIRTYAHNTTA